MISIHALREEGDLDSDIAQIIYKISIHALREEGDQRQPCIVAKLLYFYPRPPRGGRPSGGFAMGYVTKFLSTPSARRATPDSAGDHPDQRFLSTPSARRATRSRGSLQRFRIFLSTPSARRATSQAYFSFRRCIISIHALREEGDATRTPSCRARGNFYPRPPRGGRPDAPGCALSRADFYPRPPRGGRRWRHQLPRVLAAISIHALREEGDFLFSAFVVEQKHFYPRPPRGGRLVWTEMPSRYSAFLSTPSARRATEYLGAANITVQFLSTPSARRATSSS